ncbi:hypothetical protein CXB51_001567 [Gossypium anomalum]|uniref:Aminotransferase-like plant mobile domain-containing protein n=1 Tax=Gossypium anomalum TaxID=47600 RepID=A0A8J6DCH8_9ROSI|nr:hypothetical protein CXB51_001567 [Gossypium anomalum]
MGRGCEFDPTLVNALVERWRPDMHTFYLPCNECIVTLEDVQLQLGLPVDELVVIRKTILLTLQNIKDLHHIYLRERTNKNWHIFHAKYINFWSNRYYFLPTHEAIIVPELAYDLEYMPWFRHYGKPYLLEEEMKGWQRHMRRL